MRVEVQRCISSPISSDLKPSNHHQSLTNCSTLYQHSPLPQLELVDGFLSLLPSSMTPSSVTSSCSADRVFSSCLSSFIIYEDPSLTLYLSRHNIHFDSSASSLSSFSSFSPQAHPLIITHQSQQYFLIFKTFSEYSHFIEGLKLYETIQNIYLDLNIFYRDLYSQGYRCHSPIEKINIHEFHKYIMEASKVSLLTPPPPSIPSPSTPVASPNGITSVKQLNQIKLFFHQTKCIYCDKKSNNPKSELKFHPYIPIDNQMNVLYLCLECYDNYVLFRKNAVNQKLLILPGEVNEEICACCSDSPSELILCSSCPRSYCDPCLLRILSQDGYSQMKSQSNWKCMYCMIPLEKLSQISRLLCLPFPLNGGLPLSNTRHPPQSPGNTHSTPKDGGVMTGQNNMTFKTPPKQLGLNPGASRVIIPGAALQSVQPILTQPPMLSGISPLSLLPSSLAVKQFTHLQNAKIQSITVEASIESRNMKPKSVKQQEPCAPDTTPPGILPSSSDVNSKSKRSRESSLSSPSTQAQTPLTTLSGDKKVASKRGRASIQADPPPSQSPKKTRKSQSKEALPWIYHDEVFYFSQYADYLDNPKPADSNIFLTEDYCFLCKDGGELVECDYRRKIPHCHCRKVYHSYCLGFELPNDNQEWKCMKHFCGVCGVYNPAVSCRYCPNNFCENCFLDTNQVYGMLEISKIQVITRQSKKCCARGATPIDYIDIVCSNCLQMIEKCQQRGMWNMTKHPPYHISRGEGKNEIPPLNVSKT